uniref:type IV toxin-antitoxin system AbiEi family antitoxin n=1 Tax=Bordetella sputigena TaxID=1416810 RepID=UPI0039EF48E7
MFLDALDQVIGLRVESCEEEVAFDVEGKRLRLDFLVHAHLGNDKKTTALGIEVVDSAYPRDASMLLERFAARANSLAGTDEAPIVVAIFLSSGTQELLRNARINFYEVASGTLYFRHGLRHIDIQRESNQPAEKRKIRSLFSGAREQVVHALLEHWRREGDEAWVSGADLATMAGTSPFTVSTTMQEFERQAWVDVTGAGPTLRRKLIRPEQLLDAWARAWKTRLPEERRTRWYAYAGGTGGIVDHMLERLAEFDGWLMTGAAAANTVVPHLTAIDRVTIIVPPGVSTQWAADLKLEQAEKGSNVTFIERTGASLMFGDTHSERRGSRFASRFVMYLDLLDGVGRNKELAAEFRSRALKLAEMVSG